ncbi:hypothetical protein GQ457_03G039970 [Hibiscus cannabinus]
MCDVICISLKSHSIAPLKNVSPKNDVGLMNRPRLLAGKHLGYGYTTLPWTMYGDPLKKLEAYVWTLSSSCHPIMFKSIYLAIRMFLHPVRHNAMGLNSWAIQNNPESWEQSTEFKPERFLGTGDGKEWFQAVAILDRQDEVSRRELGSWQMAMGFVPLILGSLIHWL